MSRDYRADWPAPVVALDEGQARTKVVTARTHHRCMVAGLDVGTFPAHLRDPAPGDRYLRVTAYTPEGPVRGAVCADCAALFGYGVGPVGR